MPFSVAVAGASGYAGGEVVRLLATHPEARVGALTAGASAGEPLGRFHPHLLSHADRRLQPTLTEVLAGHDVIVLALPHGKSGELAAQLDKAAPDALLVDLGADHRLQDRAEWEAYYGGPHPGTWTYGMPELLTGWNAADRPAQPEPIFDGVRDHSLTPGTPPKQRAAIRQARRVAVPGCNVTAVTLALAPGIAAGTLSPEDLVAVLANGVSGAGKAAKAHLMASEILGAASPYAVGGSHRHIPEIIQNLRGAAGADAPQPSISFTPTLVPMARGILATVTARPGPAFDPATLREPWEIAYAHERFVRLLPVGVWPSTANTLGANTALIQVAHDRRAGRIILVAAIDNLVKGTAGAAVQSINLALGLPEETGLPVEGVAP
jgi:N-acetyl-gamma-glutamyl-phosphate reductase